MPVDDASIGESLFQRGPILPEDPIAAVPLQEIPLQEAEAGTDNDDMDYAEFSVDPEENPEDPPVIIIASEDEEEEWEKQEEWEEQEEDPKEILFVDGDWDADSDASSIVTIE